MSAYIAELRCCAGIAPPVWNARCAIDLRCVTGMTTYEFASARNEDGAWFNPPNAVAVYGATVGLLVVDAEFDELLRRWLAVRG